MIEQLPLDHPGTCAAMPQIASLLFVIWHLTFQQMHGRTEKCKFVCLWFQNHPDIDEFPLWTWIGRWERKVQHLAKGVPHKKKFGGEHCARKVVESAAAQVWDWKGVVWWGQSASNPRRLREVGRASQQWPPRNSWFDFSPDFASPAWVSCIPASDLGSNVSIVMFSSFWAGHSVLLQAKYVRRDLLIPFFQILERKWFSVSAHSDFWGVIAVLMESCFPFTNLKPQLYVFSQFIHIFPPQF